MYICIPAYFLLLFYFSSIFAKASVIEKRHQEVDDSSGSDDQDDPSFATSSHSSQSDESATCMNQDIFDATKIFKNPPSITNLNDYIQIKFYCEVDTTLCNQVKSSFISAALRVHKVIQFRIKIVFQASYYSFCINKCSNSTYGWGSPSSQYTLNSLNTADPNFLYPQALAKQLAQFTDSSKWVDYDVAVEINHDIYMNYVDASQPSQPISNGSTIPSIGGFWFNQTNTNTSIESYQVDIEYIILHQMVHGFGMVSSWAPYFSDVNSPFQKLLTGLIQPRNSLKIMTPSPLWYIAHSTGPTYIRGFQPSMIFDKSLNLFFSANNQTVAMMEYGFDMQNFCVPKDSAFIVYFINAFLTNATQSTRAKRIYAAMSEENTLSFAFNATTSVHSSFWTNSWLNQTYATMKLSTSLSSINSSYYRPGICTSHVADRYMGTPDFLMTEAYAKGVTLDTLVEQGYATAPTITYNMTETMDVNVTTLRSVTVDSHTTYSYETTTVQKEQTTQYTYKSAIGPGILRILETLGYSSVLTNSNYTTSVIKSTKAGSSCDNINNNNYQIEDYILKATKRSPSNSTRKGSLWTIYVCIVIICIIIY